MSLIKAMQFASKFRKKMGKGKGPFSRLSKRPKRQGLRGGMWAKKSAIDKAYAYSTIGSLGPMHKYANIHKMTKTQRFGLGRGAATFAKGSGKAHFAKRYPKTDIALGAGKVAAIGVTGAWLLNDKDMKKS